MGGFGIRAKLCGQSYQTIRHVLRLSFFMLQVFAEGLPLLSKAWSVLETGCPGSLRRELEREVAKVALCGVDPPLWFFTVMTILDLCADLDFGDRSAWEANFCPKANTNQNRTKAARNTPNRKNLQQIAYNTKSNVCERRALKSVFFALFSILKLVCVSGVFCFCLF